MTTITDFLEYLTGQVDHQPWRERVACKGMDVRLFYLDRGQSPREVRQICAGCEVQSECFDYAQESGEAFGWWGGVSERQRRRMRRTGMHTNGHVA